MGYMQGLLITKYGLEGAKDRELLCACGWLATVLSVRLFGYSGWDTMFGEQYEN
jgi:hypothetical protein